MDKVKVVYTHKGWFLFCPIWLANCDTDCHTVAPRYKLEPLLWLADQFFSFMSLSNQFKTGEPLPFCFKVDPEPLKNPVVHYYKAV